MKSSFLALAVSMIASVCSAEQIQVGMLFAPESVAIVSEQINTLCSPQIECSFRFVQTQAGGLIRLEDVSILQDWEEGAIYISRPLSPEEMVGRSISDAAFRCVLNKSTLIEAYEILYTDSARYCK